MKNSVKFFLGGIVAATLIFAAFAFTTKQTENKEYVIVRIMEVVKGPIPGKPTIQICDEKGNYSVLDIIEEGKKYCIDNEGKNTTAIAKLINEYGAKGYSMKSYNNSLGGSALYSLTTIIFEK